MLYSIALVLIFNCIKKDNALVGINEKKKILTFHMFSTCLQEFPLGWAPVSSHLSHADRWVGYSKFFLGMNMCLHGILSMMDWHPNQGVFPMWIDFGSTMTLTRMNYQ